MINLRTLVVTLLALCTLGASAQRRTISQMRDAVRLVIPAERAAHLQPLDAASLQRARLNFSNITLLSGAGGGYAVVSNDSKAPAVLAYGSDPIDLENVSPEFLYLMEMYEAMLSQPASARQEVKHKLSFTNITPLLSTSWAQGTPYYNKCPLYDGGGSRCVTGCVATAMAQVLNFHKLPKKMRGYQSYSYTNNNGHRVSHSFDFANTTFDWDNMKNSYSTSNAAQREAVATLMYACGVATNMRYSPSESAANTWVGADGINCFMDGVRAESKDFSSDAVLEELQAGRPVIYSGANSKNGAHCFVIDGCNTKGYFHCNLGWGGSGDNYYLPTDMAGYAVNYQNIVRVWPSNEIPTYTPIVELQDKYAFASHTPATLLEPNKWYVLWNAGRMGSPVSNGKSKTITNTSIMPNGEETVYNANQLIRFVPSAAGTTYYIQTGLGDYWGSFQAWGGTGVTTASKSATFQVGAIQLGYFWIKSANCYLDTNGPGSTVVGWAQNPPADTVSNSSWRIYPVTLTESPEPERELPVFDNAKTYTLRNTGYSQGYLVALTADDAQPTLRGVTQDHSQGLYKGALYHDPIDMSSEGSLWRITTEKGQQYLQNALTGKYLSNTGNQTHYVFTSEKTPIYIDKTSDGHYTFNSGKDAQSYLCAATHAEYPAAYWTATDEGSLWSVEEAERVVVKAESVTLDQEALTLFTGSSATLQASVLPENAANKFLLWHSENEEVARVDASGVVQGVGLGVTRVTATSLENSSLTASCEVRVLRSTPVTITADFSNDHFYTLRNTGYSQGYLVATALSDEHPTLRGVTQVHEAGLSDEHYRDYPDMLSPFSYWQIFTEGSDRYLYNCGTKKYLTHTGEQTCYVFTDQKTPIHVNYHSTGIYLFNAGTGANSYLCAATHLPNPAAFWSSTDKGSVWKVERVEGLDFAPLAIQLLPLEPFDPLEPFNGLTPTYDLQGRRTAQPREGLYITSGRKKYFSR